MDNSNNQNNLVLIGHMSGGGEALVDKLKEKGLTDVEKIIAQDVDSLSGALEVDKDTAEKIISSARTIIKDEPKPAEAKPVRKEKISPAPKAEKEKPILVKKAFPVKTGLRRRVWKIILPIIALTSIGMILRRRGL